MTFRVEDDWLQALIDASNAVGAPSRRHGKDGAMES
jgi:hypothetical protein